LYLFASWEGSSNWEIRNDGDWIIVSGVDIPNSSYKLEAQFQRNYNSAPELLLSQDFVMNAVKGPTERIFRIQRKSLVDIFTKKFANSQTAYLSIITALIGLLAAVIRKRLEKLGELALDYLGSFGRGRLAQLRFRKRYADYLLTSHRYLRLLGFAAAGVSRPRLEQVYIALRVSAFDTKRREGDDRVSEHISFEQAVRQYPQLAILGGPGTGKTTTLSFIILHC
jgi:hypothetical protein